MAYRVQPENGQSYANSNRRESPWYRCCSCLCSLSVSFTLTVLSVFTFLALCFIFRPEYPHYSIDGIVVKGMNLTSPSSVIWPEFDISVRADNGNKKIGIYYEKDHSSLDMFYRDIRLSNGVLPTFYQPPKNMTVFRMVLKSNGFVLEESDHRALMNVVAKRSVSLTLKVRALLKIKLGSITSLFKITVELDCVVTVDQLTTHAKKIVHKDVCDVRQYFRGFF